MLVKNYLKPYSLHIKKVYSTNLISHKITHFFYADCFDDKNYANFSNFFFFLILKDKTIYATESCKVQN